MKGKIFNVTHVRVVDQDDNVISELIPASVSANWKGDTITVSVDKSTNIPIVKRGFYEELIIQYLDAEGAVLIEQKVEYVVPHEEPVMVTLDGPEYRGADRD